VVWQSVFNMCVCVCLWFGFMSRDASVAPLRAKSVTRCN